jgi:hypothetical protein
MMDTGLCHIGFFFPFDIEYTYIDLVLITAILKMASGTINKLNGETISDSEIHITDIFRWKKCNLCSLNVYFCSNFC